MISAINLIFSPILFTVGVNHSISECSSLDVMLTHEPCRVIFSQNKGQLDQRLHYLRKKFQEVLTAPHLRQHLWKHSVHHLTTKILVINSLEEGNNLKNLLDRLDYFRTNHYVKFMWNSIHRIWRDHYLRLPRKGEPILRAWHSRQNQNKVLHTSLSASINLHKQTSSSCYESKNQQLRIKD